MRMFRATMKMLRATLRMFRATMRMFRATMRMFRATMRTFRATMRFLHFTPSPALASGPSRPGPVRVPLIAAAYNGRVPILAASQPTTVATHPDGSHSP
eukprot:135785-Prorocentrum_minimum.AAC.1